MGATTVSGLTPVSRRPSVCCRRSAPSSSKRVAKLGLPWQVELERRRPRRNRYFTVVYKDEAATHVVVLKVSPIAMRPYLAEIELKSGKRVEVMGYEDYE